MATTRLMLRKPTPLRGIGFSDQVSSSISHVGSVNRTLMCLKKVGLSTNDQLSGSERKPVLACSSSCVLVSEPKTDVDLVKLIADVVDAVPRWLELATRPRPWRLHFQMLVEKVIVDCRFFTLLAVAGSLLSSLLCYVEGCIRIIEAYSQYIRALPLMSERGRTILSLIEAIDMFLVGTAMLIFGMALHVLFVEGKKSQHPSSSLSRNSILQKLPSLLQMESAIQAKSKMGHALIMILQVEILGKIQSIPLTGALDLVCFAGTVILSSASVFVLSRIALRAVS